MRKSKPEVPIVPSASHRNVPPLCRLLFIRWRACATSFRFYHVRYLESSGRMLLTLLLILDVFLLKSSKSMPTCCFRNKLSQRKSLAYWTREMPDATWFWNFRGASSLYQSRTQFLQITRFDNTIPRNLSFCTIICRSGLRPRISCEYLHATLPSSCHTYGNVVPTLNQATKTKMKGSGMAVFRLCQPNFAQLCTGPAKRRHRHNAS